MAVPNRASKGSCLYRSDMGKNLSPIGCHGLSLTDTGRNASAVLGELTVCQATSGLDMKRTDVRRFLSGIIQIRLHLRKTLNIQINEKFSVTKKLISG
jgi:hypothetical protein